ncbi:MAG: hypothetical protein F9K44_04535 [Hyphomicrobiaceae bacterium]|nr:MAG: hypothetical protein F9K44_04535 [Hyphomicrobiaceae bacterium]
MPITEDRIRDIEGRIVALEQAQNDNTQSLRWIIKTISQMKASQDEHSSSMRKVERQIADFVSAYPATTADIVREVMKEQRAAKR